MKSTRAVALIISAWAISGLGWGVTQAAAPNQRNSFKEWCLQQASLSADARITVEVLLAEAGTNDCELAAKKLLSLTKIYLIQKGISDLNPLSELTNLEELYLGSNRIADVSPIKGFTKLKKLDLNDNQIADVHL
ncbi:MAG TPA: leucine-rich repeat domain-containing protein, partial [Kamptonema sp.]|nr:leucine-rich repeat domain-containing protein [Kamptonema sp.]